MKRFSWYTEPELAPHWYKIFGWLPNRYLPIVMFDSLPIYKPCRKGGHRHNHVRNMVIKHMVRGEKNDPRDVLYKKCADFLNQYVNPYRTLNTMIFYAVRR